MSAALNLSRLIRCFGMQMICAAACGARADDAPKVMVRAHLEPVGAVVAGTQVKLVVDCLTTTWFTEAPDWPLFDVPIFGSRRVLENCVSVVADRRART
ncbi:hypothetical protein PSAC2689_10650 [Paraburkholderia sacchari]|uniref:hypothetical protein n=1 Tax=Paraburkholderia sacchari TaxID=159450 RepID=UPI0039A40EA0